MCITYDPATLLLGIYSTEILVLVKGETLRIFIVVLIAVAKERNNWNAQWECITRTASIDTNLKVSWIFKSKLHKEIEYIIPLIQSLEIYKNY